MLKITYFLRLFPFQGTERVLGISLDMSEVGELYISEKVFSRMKNLRFLKFYTNLGNKEVKKEVKMHLAYKGLDYLSRKLRLLHWEAFPMSSLPFGFRTENLVELTMEDSKLIKVWDEIRVSVLIKSYQ